MNEEFCPYCWGAGKIQAPARNGEGLIKEDCEWCLGTGKHYDVTGVLSKNNAVVYGKHTLCFPL